MLQIYHELLNAISTERIMKDTADLTAIELGQTFPCYMRSTEHVIRLLNEAGIPNIERFSVPADGTTAIQDKIMPLGWDISVGRLTQLKNDGTRGKVLADYAEHPFHVIKGSVATPPGGMVARIITEQQFLAGEDPRGALVMLEPLTWPRGNVLVPILDQGGLGIISDFLKGRYQTPDECQWVNAASEWGSWHVTAQDRPFIGFSVSPVMGDYIREQANREENFEALVESDGRRYPAELPGVTALIPGRRQQEVWILAHLFEPLANDDSNGVAGAIEMMRLLLRRGTPEFSVRLVCACEMYGFAAYAHLRGDSLLGKVVGGCNFDSLLCHSKGTVNLLFAGPGVPFYGNPLFELLARQVSEADKNFPAISYDPNSGSYADDTFLSDASIGLPTCWALGTKLGLWHNSVQTMKQIDPEMFRRGLAFSGSLITALANPDERFLRPCLDLAKQHLREWKNDIAEHPFGSDSERMEHLYRIEARNLAACALDADTVAPALRELEECYREVSAGLSGSIPKSKWRDYAAGLVLRRTAPGFPYDQAKLPPRMRTPLPDDVIYAHYANVISNMDGVKDLACLIREAEYECHSALTEDQVKKIVDATLKLTDYGYFSWIQNQNPVTVQDIAAALRTLGVRSDDVLLVHTALSQCGHIQGGAESVLTALRDACGGEGAVLIPTFTYPYIQLGGNLNRSWMYRPFDPDDPWQIWVGALPKVLLQNHPGVLRSRHITHSWAGFGKKAAECLAGHRPDDPPASPGSPMGKALEMKGKILYFGCGLESTTFLHFLEDHFDSSLLDSAVCTVRRPDGSAKKVMIEKHLPGDRDFYHDAENCAFFQAAFAAGLEVKRAKLGIGELKLIDLTQLYEIGGRLFRENPHILDKKR